MSKHRKKESALERKATKHHDFIGEAEPERAEAKLRKRERVERETVRAMAAEFESMAVTFRIGWRLTREFLAVPAAMLRVLRHPEA